MHEHQTLTLERELMKEKLVMQAKIYQEKTWQLCERDQQDGEVDRRLVPSDGSSNFWGDKSQAIVAPDIDAPNDEELERFGEHGPVCHMRAPVCDLNAAKNF